ncbi:MAG TPA: DUF4239 domain-containing protein [Afipia sp.]
MIRAWLDMYPTGIFLILIGLYFGMTLLLGLLAFRRPFARPVQSLTGVVAPFFGATAILFALLTGFLAADVAERGRQAYRLVHAEAGELRNIHTLSVASVSDMRAIRAALKTYVNSVVVEEWPAMNAMRLSPSTAAAYDNLLHEVSIPSIAKESGQAVQSALLTAAVRVGTARNDRLSLSGDQTNDLKWLVVIALGLITQIAIALVHLERPRAFFASLAVFASAVVVTLGILALQEYPFDGAFQVSSAPIKALQSLSE